MALTDQQLGRIARECGKNGLDMPVLERVLEGNWQGAVSYAAAGETSETPLMRVLREVGEEVERAAAQVARQCAVRAWRHDGRPYGATTYVDGAWVLQEVAGRMLSREASSIWRITITNEAHGCAWTWEAGA